MVTIGEKPWKMVILGGILQDGENNYMMSEALEEYALAFAEADYE